MRISGYRPQQDLRFAGESSKKSPFEKSPAPKGPGQTTEAPAAKSGKGLSKALGVLLIGSALANVGQLYRNHQMGKELDFNQNALSTLLVNNDFTLSMDIKNFLAEVGSADPKVEEKKVTDSMKRAVFTVGNEKYALTVRPQTGYYTLERVSSATQTPFLEYYAKGYDRANPEAPPALLFSQADRQLSNLSQFQAVVRQESQNTALIEKAGKLLQELETKLFQ